MSDRQTQITELRKKLQQRGEKIAALHGEQATDAKALDQLTKYERTERLLRGMSDDERQLVKRLVAEGVPAPENQVGTPGAG